MPWVEVFVVFLVCHLVGDYFLQTEWQALNKRGGLGRNRTNRLALASHVLTYTLAFVPAFIWLWKSLHFGVFGFAAIVAVPHWIQDDGRALAAYSLKVKKADISVNTALGLALDQAFHIVALFLTALLAGT
jgi:hypothetical protein